MKGKERIFDEKSKNLKLKKMTKKKSLQEKGITLIALVVTIIILLILAGVTLNMALSQDGLFSKTQEAADKYKKAQEDEELEIEKIEYAAEGKDITEVKKITNIEDFKEFRESVNNGEDFNNTLIKLSSDLDLENEEWTPIGTAAHPFTGVFNGNGYKIKNLKLGELNEEYIITQGSYNFNAIGIFGINKGIIKNIDVEGNEIKFDNESLVMAGTITGWNEGLVESCFNNVNISSNNIYALGGIAGFNLPNGRVEKCQNSGAIGGEEMKKTCYVGGICGGNGLGASIENCCNTGNIGVTSNLDNGMVGGITSENYGNIDFCYNIAEIKLSDTSKEGRSAHAVGGICGQGPKGSITRCYNIGDVILENSEKDARLGSILGGIFMPATMVIRDCFMKDNLNLTYSWPDKADGQTAEFIEEATEITEDVKENLHERLGENFIKGDNNINNGYPILKWQK